MLTFTLEEVQKIVNLLTEAHQHWIKTSNMAVNEAISQINTFVASKRQKEEENQKKITEALAKRSNESGIKNECEDNSDKK